MSDGDNEDPNLAAIKRRVAEARAAIFRGDASVDIGQFTIQQLGLSVPVADAHGRLWRIDGGRLVLLYAPGAK